MKTGLIPAILVAALGLSGAETTILKESFDPPKQSYPARGWWGNYCSGELSTDRSFSGEQCLSLKTTEDTRVFAFDIPVDKLAGAKSLRVSVMYYLDHFAGGKIFPLYFIVSNTEKKTFYPAGGWLTPQDPNLPLKRWIKAERTLNLNGYGKIRRIVYLFLVLKDKETGKTDCDICIDDLNISVK